MTKLKQSIEHLVDSKNNFVLTSYHAASWSYIWISSCTKAPLVYEMHLPSHTLIKNLGNSIIGVLSLETKFGQ